jgi:NitT/TauT family transport system ATP-binding protein
MIALSLKNLSAAFGDLNVIDNISLEVREGEVVTLIGPSGCGKSTLLRIFAGIVPFMIPARLEGTVEVLGKKPRENSPGSIDMIFQESSLLSWRSAIKNVELGLEIIKRKDGIASQEMLEKVGLSGFFDANPGKLSGGMKQRVNIASSLITAPKLILMDEPFANLDSLSKESIWQLIGDMRGRGLFNTAVLVTHSIEEAVVLSDRVYVMSSRPGKIVGEIPVSLPQPRIDAKGLLIDGFGEVANQIRASLRKGG